MSTIGEVTLQKDGKYVGQLKTLSMQIPIEIAPVKKTVQNGPDYMIRSRGVECGAAWLRKGQRSGKDYVSCSFTAPEFGKPFYANLGRKPGTKAEEKVYSLIHNQQNGRAD